MTRAWLVAVRAALCAILLTVSGCGLEPQDRPEPIPSQQLPAPFSSPTRVGT
jgi:hypothetical protein